MTTHTLGMIIGGLVPALGFSASNLFMKASTEQQLSVPLYIIAVGIAVVLTGFTFYFFMPHARTLTYPGVAFAFGSGIAWGIGIGCATIALQVYGTPLSVLVPLFNMNTLISVLIALWVFAEWKNVQSAQLLLGTVLIVVGGTLVARA